MNDTVGPVLEASDPGRAVVAAIRKLNGHVTVIDRGSYLRVLVPQRCVVTREAIEAEYHQAFVFPRDLEQIMPSFKGRMHLNAHEASWVVG